MNKPKKIYERDESRHPSNDDLDDVHEAWLNDDGTVSLNVTYDNGYGSHIVRLTRDVVWAIKGRA